MNVGLFFFNADIQTEYTQEQNLTLHTTGENNSIIFLNFQI